MVASRSRVRGDGGLVIDVDRPGRNPNDSFFSRIRGRPADLPTRYGSRRTWRLPADRPRMYSDVGRDRLDFAGRMYIQLELEVYVRLDVANQEEVPMLGNKTLTSFRLSDHCKDQLQDCVELQRKIDGIDRTWHWGRRDRTDAVTRAVDHYKRYLESELARLSPPASSKKAKTSRK